jgi:hypothetical protein
VFIFSENKEPSDLAFQNKHLSMLHPKITPTSEPQIVAVTKPQNQMVFQEKGLNAIAYSEIGLCLNHFSLHICTTEHKLNVAVSSGPRYSAPVFWIRELCQTGWRLTVSSAQCFHARLCNFPHLKLKQTQIN